MQKHICVASRAVNTEDDIELGEMGGRGYFEVHEEWSSAGPVEKAKKDFRRSLQKMFSDAARVESIMSDIRGWELG